MTQTITITITGQIKSGPSWEALQELLSGVLNQDSRITRIVRRDKGCNYRAASGVYDVECVPEMGDVVNVELFVNPPTVKG